MGFICLVIIFRQLNKVPLLILLRCELPVPVNNKHKYGKFCVCFKQQPSNLGPSKCAKFGLEALAVGTQRMNEAADIVTYRSKTAVSGSTYKK